MATNAPASTYVVVSSLVATFCAFGTVVIFLPPWQLYLIPAACALPGIVVLAQRYMRRRRIKRDMNEALASLG